MSMMSENPWLIAYDFFCFGGVYSPVPVFCGQINLIIYVYENATKSACCCGMFWCSIKKLHVILELRPPEFFFKVRHWEGGPALQGGAMEAACSDRSERREKRM